MAALLAAATAVGSITSARAVTFYYDSYGGFVSGTDSPAASGTFVNDPDTATGGAYDVGADADSRTAAGRFANVTWGVAAGALGPYDGESGFALSKVDDGVVVTDGPLVDFGKLTHFNRPIFDPSLDSAQLDWSLQLFATPQDAAANVNPVRTINMSFTLYNWETLNVAAENPAYSVSYDNGATWTTVGPGVCPGSTPAGTLIIGPLGKIYQSAFTDQPLYPPWNGECADAHIYEGGPGNVNTFSHDGRLYRVELVGFYGPFGDLTQTFWACENNQCFGTVKFRILEVAQAAAVPVDSGALLMVTSLLLAGLGWRRLWR
jgi:hypothetical protein